MYGTLLDVSGSCYSGDLFCVGGLFRPCVIICHRSEINWKGCILWS